MQLKNNNKIMAVGINMILISLQGLNLFWRKLIIGEFKDKLIRLMRIRLYGRLLGSINRFSLNIRESVSKVW
jgi:hypothetical protein